jgi:polysaccharide biosynthesis transport protein
MTQHMTLNDYLSVLARRKWVVIQALLIVPLTAVLIALRQDAVYSASSEVFLSRQDIGSQLLGLTNSNLYTDPERFAQTQADLGGSPELAQRVVKAAHVDESPGALLASSGISPKPNADILVFSVRNHDPAAAMRLANAYADQFTGFRRELDTSAMRTTLQKINARLNELRAAGQTSDDKEFSSLLATSQQLRTLENLQGGNTRVVRNAEGAAKVEPKPKRNFLIGIFAGLVLGVSLAFLAEALDKRVRTAEEIEAALGLPLLARLPPPSRERRRDEELVMMVDPSSPEAEGFRVLRTNIAFLNADGKVRTIMVTSAVAAEGKSTTAANLAVAMARAGSRVALVDLDLHNPVLHRFFNFSSRPGFSDVTLELAQLNDAVQTVRIKGGTPDIPPTGNGRGLNPAGTVSLDVLPAGILPINAGEFVESKAAASVLAQLAERYDFVLIDTPPVLAVGDAMALSSRVDAMVVVARPGLLERPSLRDLGRTLEQSPARKLGLVVAGGGESQADYTYGSYGTGRRSAERGAELVS